MGSNAIQRNAENVPAVAEFNRFVACAGNDCVRGTALQKRRKTGLPLIWRLSVHGA
jgi:hypothetical protein